MEHLFSIPPLPSTKQSYQERLRQELRKTVSLRAAGNAPVPVPDSTPNSELGARHSLELTEAIPPTEVLNVEAQKSKVELVRQGSLAERNLPSSYSLSSVTRKAANAAETETAAGKSTSFDPSSVVRTDTDDDDDVSS